MTMPEPEGPIMWIRRLGRRLVVARDRPEGDGRHPEGDRLQALEGRIADLERLVEGLQDSVHRESERHSKLIAELRGQVQPGAMGAALAEDARNRGL
jgi:hypothetical protein